MNELIGNEQPTVFVTLDKTPFKHHGGIFVHVDSSNYWGFVTPETI